jgi:hypothetical protein
LCKVTLYRFVQGNHHAPPASQNHAVIGNPGVNYWRCLKYGAHRRDESRVGAANDVMDFTPAKLGISFDSPAWIILMLTLTGIAVGLVIRFSPGHAGPDPAQEP